MLRDVLAYLKLIANPGDATSFLRIVNVPRRGIGDATLTALAQWAAAERAPLLEAAGRAREIPACPTAGAAALVEFAQLIDRYAGLAAQLPAAELLRRLLAELRFLEFLREVGEEGEERAANVEELVAGAADFRDRVIVEEPAELLGETTELDLFLQQVTLLTDVDRMDPEADAVTLMTLHNAKGLEFSVVFVTGLEEGLFPLARAYDTRQELEEERRLFYVGITRAREALLLTHARARRRGGDRLLSSPSSFLDSVPEERVLERETERSQERRRRTRAWSAEEVGAGWGRRYEYEPEGAEDVPQLLKGERVRHPHFGLGTVLGLDGGGPGLKATIDFDGVGRKRVLVRHANLEKVWE